MKTFDIKLSKEQIISIIVALKNYENRIEYLERENKLKGFKLNRIKTTTLKDIKEVIDYFDKIILLEILRENERK